MYTLETYTPRSTRDPSITRSHQACNFSCLITFELCFRCRTSSCFLFSFFHTYIPDTWYQIQEYDKNTDIKHTGNLPIIRRYSASRRSAPTLLGKYSNTSEGACPNSMSSCLIRGSHAQSITPKQWYVNTHCTATGLLVL